MPLEFLWGRSTDQALPSSMKLFHSPNPDPSPPISPDFGADLADYMESKPIQESQEEVGQDCARGRHEIVLDGNATVYVSFFQKPHPETDNGGFHHF